MFLDIVLTIHFLLLIVIYLRVLTRDDLTSAARLAWMVVLFVLPYIGVVVYWLFGEIHLGRYFERDYSDIISRLHARNPEVLGSDTTMQEEIDSQYHAAFAYCANVTGFGTTTGNQGELMRDADDTRQRMIADFDAATDHIHVLYYIWLIDGTGIDTAQALIRAAKRGVKCRAMVDGMGSRKMVRSKLWREMQEAGVELSVAMPIRNIIKVLLFSRIDLRNHRKITVIDGNIGYCGSRNCADPEFRIKPKFAPWVDIMLRVQGPIVAQNQMLFASDWLMQNPETPIDSFPFKDVSKRTKAVASNQSAEQTLHAQAIKPSSTRHDHKSNYEYEHEPKHKVNTATDKCQRTRALANTNDLTQAIHTNSANDKVSANPSSGFVGQVFADGPTQRRGTTPQFLGSLIGQAKREITISTPYFVPDYSLIHVLCAAAYRGVRVTMIFPKHNDSLIVSATSHSYYLQLLEAGIVIYEYTPGLLHAKTLTVDGEISLIGSTNLDLRSFDLNYENNIIFSDKDLSADIMQRQQQYIADSENVSLAQVKDWPIWYRVWNHVVATMGPIL